MSGIQGSTYLFLAIQRSYTDGVAELPVHPRHLTASSSLETIDLEFGNGPNLNCLASALGYLRP